MASSVKLGDTLETYVDQLVTRGRYGSRSEVLREGVRLVQQREEWLRMVQGKADEGRAQIARGEGVPLDEAFERVIATIDRSEGHSQSASDRGPDRHCG